ncbi:MAG: DUF853 family protein, partial [Clostridia bacterium]|nr:DUF853 family protein [Clostridia bacterium]
MYISDLEKIWLATGENRIYLEPSMANRHGLIAGATGTGKTVTLKVIAESFSEMGIPVFVADIKGDLTGMCVPGTENKHIRRSIDTMGIEDFTYTSYPVRFFDVYGEKGHPIRTTVSDMGPDLLARLLGLNETQSGVLRIVFRIADDQGLLLLDLKDLRSMVVYVGEHSAQYKLQKIYSKYKIHYKKQASPATRRKPEIWSKPKGDFFYIFMLAYTKEQ